MTLFNIKKKGVSTEEKQSLSFNRFDQEDGQNERDDETTVGHAQQLLMFLKRRQSEIDRRESVLNARIARFESKVREVNFDVQEKKRLLREDEELASQRKLELDRREEELRRSEEAFCERSRQILDEIAAKKQELLNLDSSLSQRAS